MEIKVNDVSITLTGEQLAQIDAELKKRNNIISAEQRFLEMWNGCIQNFDFEKNPNRIFLLKNNGIWFQQDLKNDILWCDYNKVCSVFEKEYGMKYNEIQSFIKDILERRFKLGYLTPVKFLYLTSKPLERRFKLGYLTPSQY